MEKNLYIDATHPNETRVVLKSNNNIEDYEYEGLKNNLIKNKCIAHDNDDIFYIDGAHLSRSGSMLINKEIMKIINIIYK